MPAGGSVTLEWESICHAADYLIYREVAGEQQLVLIKTVSTPFSAILPDNSVGEATSTTNVTGGGESQQTLIDTGTAGTAEPAGWTPPSTENAVESAWEQNPYFIPALEAVGITAVGDDASKAYPDPANAEFGIGATYKGAEYAAGETFLEGTSAGRAASPDQHLLQRLDRGAGGRRVQHAVSAAVAGWRMRGELDHDVRDGAGNIRRHREQRRLGHVPEHDGQRPAAELRPPDEHHRPPAGRDRRPPARRRTHPKRPETGCSTRCSTRCLKSTASTSPRALPTNS